MNSKCVNGGSIEVAIIAVDLSDLGNAFGVRETINLAIDTFRRQVCRPAFVTDIKEISDLNSSLLEGMSNDSPSIRLYAVHYVYTQRT